MKVLKHFSQKKTFFFHFCLSSFSLSFSLSSSLFYCLASSLLLSLIFSLLSLVSSLSSVLFSCVSSSLFSLHSCLVSSSLVLSCFVFFCLLFSCLSSAVFSSLSCSVSLSLSLSVSVCLCLSQFLSHSVSLCLCLRVVVLWWCVWWWWWCVVWHRENPVCPLKTSPCVRSKRSRVYRHHAHMLKHMCAWCRHTRGRFERTHLRVLNGHTARRERVIVNSAYQNLPKKGYHLTPEVHKK